MACQELPFYVGRGVLARANNAAAFSCSDRFRSRVGSFYYSYFQSSHVPVLLWMPLCEQGRGEIAQLSLGLEGGQSSVCVCVNVLN